MSRVPARPRATVALIALASVMAIPRPTPAQVYRLHVVTAECMPHGCRLVSASCSAVAIGRHKPGKELFLSAGHCLRGNVRSVSIEFGGSRRPAVVLAVSRHAGRDLAVLGADLPRHDVHCVAIADHPPAAGEPVMLASYPGGGEFEQRAGRVVPHGYRDVELVVNVPTRPGESGGAILDRHGRLAGIISATGPLAAPDHTLATGVTGIREMLRETFRAGVPHCGSGYAEPGNATGHDAPPAPTGPDSPDPDPHSEQAEPAGHGPRARDADCCRPELDARIAQLTLEIERLETRLVELGQRQIPVQVLSPDGRVAEERRVPLGEPIQLRLVPVNGIHNPLSRR